MTPGDIYLGLPGNEILLPAVGRKVTPQTVEIVKSQRMASGRLREQVIRIYTNYQIDYDLLTGEEWDLLQSLYNLGQYLTLQICNRDGSITSQTVKVHPISGTRESVGDVWIYSGVTVTLEAV